MLVACKEAHPEYSSVRWVELEWGLSLCAGSRYSDGVVGW